jgi:hypothetical protein
MSAKILCALSAVLFVSGCQIIGQFDEQVTEPNQAAGDCVFLEPSVEQWKYCDVDIWLQHWSALQTLTWPQRKGQIEGLSDKPVETLKKILLSQGKDTPYQDRLRAQGWVTSLMPMLSDDMQHFMTVAIYQPSQELLELESALVTLSKVSTHLANQVEEQTILIEQQKGKIELQKQVLDQQQNQIEQLLKIEASIMDNSKGNNR